MADVSGKTNIKKDHETSQTGGESHKTILLSAGEASGDLIAAQVAGKLTALVPGIRIFGMGGNKMREAGVEIIRPMPEVMGLGSPLGKLGVLAASISSIVIAAKRRRPSAAILVDFPDFHLGLARILKGMGVPVFQFVSPQIWAWRPGRIKTVKKVLTKTFLIFPFEKEIYDKAGAPSEFVGHPAADRLTGMVSKEEARKILKLNQSDSIVALLPGTRKAVLKRHLPLFLSTAGEISGKRNGIKFLMSLKELPEDDRYKNIPDNLIISDKNGPLLLRAADAALVSSGTAALESVLLGVPFAGVYSTSAATYHLVKILASVKYILMANILSGKELVREFIQQDANPDMMAAEILSLLDDREKRAGMISEFNRLSSALGPFDAPGKVAETIVKFCEK